MTCTEHDPDSEKGKKKTDRAEATVCFFCNPKTPGCAGGSKEL